MTATPRKLKPFPLRVRHHPDEPAHALLLRTAAHNGMSRFSPVFKRCGVLFGRSVQLVDPLLVAHLCGIEPENLLRGSVVPVDDDVSVLGQTLRHDHVGGWWRRWCPACLEEDPYHRVWWDLAVVTTCPLHGVELATSCGCDQPLVNGRQGLTRCNRDHDLTKTAVKPLSDAELAAERYVLDRLLGRGQHPHQLLDRTTLGQAIWVLERIGGSALAEGLSTDDARAKFGIRQLLSAGFETLSDFPRSFDEFLDVLVSRRQEKDLRSETTAYGPLRFWMGTQIAKGRRCEVITKLRKAFTRHAKRNVIDRRRVLDGGQAFPGLPLRQAAEQCGLGPDVFVRLSKLLGIRIEAEVSGVATLVPPNQLQQITDQLSALHTMEEVIETLGVRWPRVIDLADQGHLPYVCRPYDRSEPQGKRGDKPTTRLRDRDWNRWYFQPDAAENFLSLMRSKIVIDPEADIDDEDDDLVEMLHVTTMYMSFDQVIRLVLAGALPLRGIDETRPGLTGLLVSKTEAMQIMKLERREGHPLRAAAPLMGMTYNQLRTCIITNLITPAGEGKSLSITDDMIEAFKAKYVRAKELAEVFGLKDSRIVIRYLREHDMEPLQVDGELGITLYLREEAMPLAESLPPPVVFRNARERARYQKANGLPVEATRKRSDTSQDWNKRGNDRSGKKILTR